MGRLIIDGNKVYEIDEKCMERKKEKKNNEENKRKRGGNRKYRQKLKKARNHKAPGFLVPAKNFHRRVWACLEAAAAVSVIATAEK